MSNYLGRFKSWAWRTRDGYAGEVERRDKNPWNIGKLLPKGHGRDGDEPEKLGEPSGHHTHIHLPQTMSRAAAHGADDDADMVEDFFYTCLAMPCRALPSRAVPCCLMAYRAAR